jgi:hypothetical protein
MLPGGITLLVLRRETPVNLASRSSLFAHATMYYAM